jgi:endoglucanase
MLSFRPTIALALSCLVTCAANAPSQASTTTQDQNWLAGVNLDAGSFNPDGDRLHFDYTYPTKSEIDYYTGKGARIVRIPFLAKRVTVSDGKQHLAPSEDLSIIAELTDYAATKDALVVLDMHDYGASRSGKLIGRDPGSVDEFAATWETIARHFKDRPNVVFGLMNEPNRQTAAEWLTGANAAVAAIRRTGAKQLVLVPGSYWDSAHTWTSTDNAEVMLGVQDSANNFAFEVHQYLDEDNSGTHTSVVPDAGTTRLEAFTDWARKHRVKGFLGEFGWADNPQAHREGRGLLCFMSRNRDVWLGWTYWAGGPWWGEYMFSVEPRDGVDRPQMKILSEFLAPSSAPDCA